ncbi:MAG: Ig-like domain-containing protein [Lysobacterales bacterium]
MLTTFLPVFCCLGLPGYLLAQPALVGGQVSVDAGSTGNAIILDYLGTGSGVVAGEIQLSFSSPDIVITHIDCRLIGCAGVARTGRLVFLSLALTEVPDTTDAIEVTFNVASETPAGPASLQISGEQYSDLLGQPVPSTGGQDGALMVNRVPIARDDSYSVKEDSPMLMGDLRSDNGHGADELGTPPYRYQLEGSTSLGVLALTGDQGLFRYQADENAAGVDLVGYTIVDSNGTRSNLGMISVVIDPTPDPVDDLVLLNDTGVVSDGQVTMDNGLGVDDLGNGPSTVVTLVAPVRALNFEMAVDGSFTYAPDATFVRSDHFTYMVTDADGDQGPAAMVTVLQDSIFDNNFEPDFNLP